MYGELYFLSCNLENGSACDNNLQSEVFISTLLSFAFGQRQKEKGKMYSRHGEILK